MTNPEKQIIELTAVDRLEIPLSSIEQKLRKQRANLAVDVAEYCEDGVRYSGQRTYAFTEIENKERARGIKEAIAEFVEEYPKYGAILEGKIAEKRTRREKHLYFGLNSNSKLAASDYIQVMKNIGLSEAQARALYGPLMNTSRQISKARSEERSILVG